MNSNLYDKLKFMALIGLPALGSLYFALSGIWGLPYGEQVVGTITVIDTFLGAILGLSTKGYNTSDAKYDGDMVIDSSGNKVSATMALNKNVGPLIDQSEVTFRVVHK